MTNNLYAVTNINYSTYDDVAKQFSLKKKNEFVKNELEHSFPVLPLGVSYQATCVYDTPLHRGEQTHFMGSPPPALNVYENQLTIDMESKCSRLLTKSKRPPLQTEVGWDARCLM